MQRIEAFPRVVSESVKPFEYGSQTGEVTEVRAIGTYGEHRWPVSLHITVPPGCGAIPAFGDRMRVTVEPSEVQGGPMVEGFVTEV